NCARAVMLDARDAAPAMLAGDQPALAVDRMAVMVHRRGEKDRDRAVGVVVAQHAVVRDVRPDEIFAGGEIGRPLRPAAAGIELFEMDIAMGELFKTLVKDLDARREHGTL